MRSFRRQRSKGELRHVEPALNRETLTHRAIIVTSVALFEHHASDRRVPRGRAKLARYVFGTVYDASGACCRRST